MTTWKSSGVSVFCSSGVESPVRMLNLKRPTREKSYFRGSKNMPTKRFFADSSVGGSPGRILL